MFLDEKDFLSSIDNEVASGVVGALLEVSKFFLGFSDQVALGAAEHDGHSANFDIFSLLSDSVEAVLDVDT